MLEHDPPLLSCPQIVGQTFRVARTGVCCHSPLTLDSVHEGVRSRWSNEVVIAGIAFIGTLCTDSAVSVVEEYFTATSGAVSAHELGHRWGWNTLLVTVALFFFYCDDLYLVPSSYIGTRVVVASREIPGWDDHVMQSTCPHEHTHTYAWCMDILIYIEIHQQTYTYKWTNFYT